MSWARRKFIGRWPAECSIAISLTEPEVQSAVTSAHARPRPPTVGGRLAARQSTLGLEN
jgi:hypothetical protein